MVSNATWGLGLAVLLLCFLAYRLGHSRGQRQGRRLGREEASIRIRQEALTTGRCPLCDQNPRPFRYHDE